MDNRNSIVFCFSEDNVFFKNITKKLQYESGKCTVHRFPDSEILMRIETNVANRDVLLICSTDHPNDKLAHLIFFAETARALGATKVGLISPYLAYMRQDKQFHPGEGVSSRYFGKLISAYFDWLLTIDPHLHRWHSLNDVFTIPCILLHATKPIAQWIKQHITNPVLIGPDKESTQWVSMIANDLAAPYSVVEKTRFSDIHVESTIPNIEQHQSNTLVLIDDIISTGRTMIETIHHVKSLGCKNIVCIGVHAIFAANAYQALLETNIKEIVTCNSVSHESNQIDLSDIIIHAL